jgi:hypothetical protein
MNSLRSIYLGSLMILLGCSDGKIRDNSENQEGIRMTLRVISKKDSNPSSLLNDIITPPRSKETYNLANRKDLIESFLQVTSKLEEDKMKDFVERVFSKGIRFEYNDSPRALYFSTPCEDIPLSLLERISLNSRKVELSSYRNTPNRNKEQYLPLGENAEYILLPLNERFFRMSPENIKFDDGNIKLIKEHMDNFGIKYKN